MLAGLPHLGDGHEHESQFGIAIANVFLTAVASTIMVP